MNFLGQRYPTKDLDTKGKPIMGPYVWKTYNEVNTIAQRLAKGMVNFGLCPETEGDGRMWRFMGVWSKNRWEWATTLIACMHFNITTVGFFEAMGQTQVDFIFNQTEMTSILCSGQYVQKIIDMKNAGLATHIKNLVLIDDISEDLIKEASSKGITIYTFDQVLQEGDKECTKFVEPTGDDCYIFSYTSGTTGDSKGVKLSHVNIMTNAAASICRSPLGRGDTYISYLPMTHSFEQGVFALALMNKLGIGFYQGDPLKLTEDCQMLKPHFFPSVPRLYNRIYGKIKSGMDDKSGCAAWLLNKGLAAKTANLNTNAAYNHGCYDKLIFGKVAGLLGGNVRMMVTGSAPIDKAVLDFLKICFCCPILEGYGLTESSAGSCITDMRDPVAGHVGGPTEYVKFRLKDLPEMEYRIDDKPYPRGEVCMKGPSIFSGYYKRPDKTEECFDSEGWFMTGDVAQIYPNGSVKIIDRSKNIFKLSQGEYIAPEKIENIFVLSSFVGQSFVYGDSLKNNVVAIVVPDKDAVTAWGKAAGTANPDYDTICADEQFKKDLFADLIKLATANKLSSLEKPKDICIYNREFTVDNDILTPTFKLKRNIAKKVFEEQINAMYAKIESAEQAAANKK